MTLARVIQLYQIAVLSGLPNALQMQATHDPENLCGRRRAFLIQIISSAASQQDGDKESLGSASRTMRAWWELAII